MLARHHDRGCSHEERCTVANTGLPPVVSVAGRAKVGKTTFLVKLIAELTRRGYRIGVIKHSVHEFTLSEPGRDTWRHAQAGANVVAFATKSQLAIAHQLDHELDLDEIVPHLGPVDLILTEGYKQAHKPKIEVTRRERGTGLICRVSEIIAVVGDYIIESDIPQFDLDDATGVADLLEQRYLRHEAP
jgi:molybdopterin-guanine dinucleotide biosynthesis protein B